MTTIKNQRRSALGKHPLSCVLSSVVAFSSALANPQNHTVVEGNTPVVTANGSELSIATDGRTILNWNSFSIASGELTRFVMSGSDRAVLNRVTGGTLSQIDGSLEANGRLYLINPNGVLVGASGVVQTQSFIASTRELTDEDFMGAGALAFFGIGTGEVHNLGTIAASDGDVALIGNRILSSGSITAPRGVVALAAGDDVMLAAPGSERLLVRVNRASDESTPLLDHTGLLNAAQVELQAAGGNPFALAVNAGGQINATGVDSRQGRIYLTTDAARIDVPGTLTARNSDGTGGIVNIESGVDYGSEIAVGGTLDVTSTTSGGIISLRGGRLSLSDSAHLATSADLTAGSIVVGTGQTTDYVYVASGALLEANSSTGEAGIVDLAGAGIYFYGQFSGRGAVRPGQLTLRPGEALEYAGLADLRSWNDATRFGLVDIAAAYSNLDIAPGDSSFAALIDADALATQLNYSNVLIATWGAEHTVNLHTPLSWQSATRLSLQAGGDIDIDQAITASNGSLQLSSVNGNVTAAASISVRDLWLSSQGDVNLTNRIVAENVTLYDVGARTLLTNEQNQIGTVTFTRDLRARSGEVDIVDSAGGLTLTTSNVGALTYATDGNFRARTSGDLTLASAFQSQVDGDVTLVATGGVIRNQSAAAADVFGTSSTGLDRTLIYAAGVGENGGLAAPAQYNVSYSPSHEATANTGFYYSGNAPQEPNPPLDPPPVPETPLPRSQIIRTALNGNSFEQLNRPPQEDPSRLPALPPAAPSPPDSGVLTLTSAVIDQLEQLALSAGIDGDATKQRDTSVGEQQQQPSPRVVDQLEDAAARMMSLLQAAGAGSSGPSVAQLMQGLSSPELQQLFIQSPAVFQQQLAIVLTQFATGRRNAALEGRAQALNQQIDQIKQAAEQMRNAAIEQMTNAIVTAVSQIVQTALNDATESKFKTPIGPKTPPPLPIPTPTPEPIKNVQQPGPSEPPGFKLPPQLTPPPPIVVPVAPPLPPSVQNAFRMGR